MQTGISQPEALTITSELRTELVRLYGARLRELYLFGSYSRGEQSAESDLDILIVLDGVHRYGDEIEKTSETISRLSLNHGISISRVFVSAADWKRRETRFLRTIAGEVISV